jgi:GldM C-terminal domain
MMKPFIVCYIFFLFSYVLNAQHSAISADKMNVLYATIDNPLTIAAENCPCNKLVVKSSLGTITKEGKCKFNFRSTATGAAEIRLYQKSNNTLKLLDVFSFRVKGIPNPIFKIGPYGGENHDGVHLGVLVAQNFVRADLENFDFEARFRVDSFRVSITNYDSCKVLRFNVITSRVPDEVKTELYKLKESDFIVFDNIYASGPDGLSRRLDPLTLVVGKQQGISH